MPNIPKLRVEYVDQLEQINRKSYRDHLRLVHQDTIGVFSVSQVKCELGGYHNSTVFVTHRTFSKEFLLKKGWIRSPPGFKSRFLKKKVNPRRLRDNMYSTF